MNNDPARLIIDNGLVRYVDEFIVVTNSREEIPFLKKGVEKFLLERGLKINHAKSKVIK